MDKEVYSSEKVSSFVNSKFISVRLQMDSTKHDNFSIRKRYNTAAAFMHQYKINVFRLIFFFSPDGKILNKQKVIKKNPTLLILSATLSILAKQYCTLIESYQKGSKHF